MKEKPVRRIETMKEPTLEEVYGQDAVLQKLNMCFVWSNGRIKVTRQ